MAPAVHVAVKHFAVCQEVSRFLELFGDDRLSFPDVLAAEKRKALSINTVALNRIENIVVVTTVAFEGIEVIHTVSRR